MSRILRKDSDSIQQTIMRSMTVGLLALLPFTAEAQTGIAVGYTGCSTTARRGQVFMRWIMCPRARSGISLRETSGAH